jgi:outer membrane protein, multidrug efflux system
MHRGIVLLTVVAFLLCGCAIGPDYRRPGVEVPAGFRTQAKDAVPETNTDWWRQFADPVLDGLIQTALNENNDLKLAAARVEEYVGYYWVDRSGYFPFINATGARGENRVTERGTNSVPSYINNPDKFYQLAFNGSWEIDLWGRIRRANEAGRADLLNTEEARRGVILSLVTAVADGYIALRDLDRQLEIATETAKSRGDWYDLFKLRFQGGVISELELYQAQSEYEQTLATIPNLERQIARQENGLSVLIGKNPGPIERGKNIDELRLFSIPAGLPSDLLERRPDIRQAEAALVAANARIGVAKSLYFPTISLTGLFGWSSTHLSDLFVGPAKTWNFAVAFDAPIFQGGAIMGQNKVARAQYREALINYRQTIQNAFRDVDDSLSDRKKLGEQLQVQGKQVESTANYASVARLRYENGYTSYLDVLDAERSLFSAQLSYAQTQGNLFSALINVYKSMGGGWVVELDRQTAEQRQ